MPLELKPIDRAVYSTQLAPFLPPRLVDIHTHIWLRAFVDEAKRDPRLARWPDRVAAENSYQDLQQTYRLLFPEQEVTPLLFGWPERNVDLAGTNRYVAQAIEQHGLSGLAVSIPEWSAQETERQVAQGRFLGLKPYLSFAPPHLGNDEINIFDFLPHHQLEVAGAHRWIVMLHIPRSGRLRDPLNLRQLLEIERRYPGVQLVIAHIGRAYCPEDVGDAFDVLRGTERMLFDFSANTNGEVMAGLLRAAGPQRVLFGSDLPIARMRMRRVCEHGLYVNLVPPGLYGDIGDDLHMREVDRAEGERLSFFLYEELLAFRRAVEATGLTRQDVEDVLCNNALHLIANATNAG
jgi:uncharacterized protein